MEVVRLRRRSTCCDFVVLVLVVLVRAVVRLWGRRLLFSEAKRQAAAEGHYRHQYARSEPEGSQ